MKPLGELLALINKGENIALIGHRDGDGDSFGSMYSLKYGLEQLAKKASIISEEPLPPNLAFFTKFGKVTFDNEYINHIDLLIILDTPDLARVSSPDLVRMYQKKDVKIILIDHHLKGDLSIYANCSYVEQTSCSTSEIIYEIMQALKVKIDKKIATYLLTGIETDTTSFQNQNTTSKSLKVASELVTLGARLNLVIKNSFSNQSLSLIHI